MVDQGVDPKYGIVEAAEKGHLETVKLLLDKGANPITLATMAITKNSDALCLATNYGHKEIVELLLDNKADPNSQYFFGNSCLRIALAKNQTEIAEMLRQAGATIPSLTGQWKINYEITSFIDDSGGIVESQKYYTKYIDLTQNESVVAGEITSVDGTICKDATFSGKNIKNNINLTEKFSGSCCPNAQLSYEGKIDYSSSMTKIVGKLKPSGKAPEDCNLWWGNF